MSLNKITLEELDEMAAGGDLNTYQRIATKSAIYPGQDTHLGLIYTALKLNGEAGEFAEHVGKAMRDDALGSKELTPQRRKALIAEAGDVLWYLSAICNELGITLSHVAEMNLDKLYDRGVRNKLSGSGDNR